MATTPTPSPSSTHQSLLGDLTGLSSSGHTSHDNRLNDSAYHSNTTLLPSSNALQASLANSNTTKISSNKTNIGGNTSTTPTTGQNIIKMLPTSQNSGNNATAPGDDMENTREDSASCAVADLTITSSAVDLATDNLPAVDTPDACDKAALR